MAALLQRPLTGELRDGRGQLAFQPLLLAAKLLDHGHPLGVIAAVGGGEDEPGQPGPCITPGRHGPPEDRIGPGPTQGRGLAIVEDLRQSGFPIPDPPVGFVIAGGHAKGHRDQAIPSQGQLGQVAHRLGFRGGSQQCSGQGL